MTEDLTAEETAYVESRGETDLPAEGETPPVQEVEAAQPQEQAAEEAPATTDETPSVDPVDETPVEETAAAEEKAEPAEAEQKDSDWVPKSRFDAKIRQVEDIALQLKTEQEKHARLEGRVDQMLKAAEPDPPDQEMEPEAFLEHQLAEKDKELAVLRQDKEVADTRKQESDEVQKVHQAWQSQVVEANDPHYQEMQDFLLENRRQELRDLGLTDPGKIEAQLGLEVWNAANGAHRMGASIPKVMGQMARAKGWQPKSESNEAAANDKLDTIERGQKAQSALKDGGTGAGGSLTKDKLASMSQEEFDDWCDKNPNYMKRIQALSG